MPNPMNPVNPLTRIRTELRWALVLLALLCVVGAGYLILKGSSWTNNPSSDGPDPVRFSRAAFADRWIALDEITRPDARPHDITELTITVDQGLFTVEMRGQQVDEVYDGNRTQRPCPADCMLGIAYATLEGDTLVTSIETAPGLTHELTLKVKAPTPGSDALLTVVDRLMLGSKTLASSTREFVSNGLIHPERMMDTGLPKLR
jgi:hypothetical protein